MDKFPSKLIINYMKQDIDSAIKLINHKKNKGEELTEKEKAFVLKFLTEEQIQNTFQPDHMCEIDGCSYFKSIPAAE